MECLINGYVPTELMINGKVISGCAKGGNVVYRKKNADFATNYGDEIITTNDTVYAQIKNLNIYGKSTVEDDVISSVGDSGSIEVGSCGKNLFDKDNGIVSGYHLRLDTGELETYVADFYQETYIKVKPNTTYYQSSSSSSWLRLIQYDKNKNFISGSIFLSQTMTSETEYVRVSTGGDRKALYQLEIGTSATDYEPYQGSTQTLTLAEPLRGIETSTNYNYTNNDGQTWLSDVLDVQSGVITRNISKVIFDGTESWGYYSPTNAFYLYNELLNMVSYNAMSNLYTLSNSLENGTFNPNTGNGNVSVYDYNFDNVNDWKTYLADLYASGTPLTIIYPTNSPTTEQIDTTSLKKLRSYNGQTNLFVSDNAGLKADFRMDLGDKVIKGYILDYIESTGTQWIDTGVTMNNNLEIEAYFAVTTTYNVLNYSGAVLSANSGWIVYGSYALNYLVAFFCKQVREGATISFDNEYHYYKLSATEQQIDDTFSYINSGVPNASTIKLYLFRGNTDFGAKFTLGGKSKFQKIFKSGNLIQQLIPYQTLDGTICMYDTVTNTTFENQGTGEFLGGEIIGYITEDNIAYNNDGTLYNPDITAAVMSMGVEPAETQTLQLAQLEELGVTI